LSTYFEQFPEMFSADKDSEEENQQQESEE
jgi:hypothetical protein